VGRKKQQPVELRTQTATREQQEFLDLVKRFRNATDREEASRLGDKLGRLVFGG